MNKYQSIGQFIKAKREELGLTQQQLANKLEITAATLSLYESGDRNPDLNKLEKIAKELEVSMAALLDIEIPQADLDIALRSEKLGNDDIKEVRKYIQTLKYARQARQKAKSDAS